MAIDAMIPIGRGHANDHWRSRDRKIDDRDRHDHQPGAIEQGGRRSWRQELRRSIAFTWRLVRKFQRGAARSMFLEREGAMPYTTIISRPRPTVRPINISRRLLVRRWASWFMDNGMDALIIYDDCRSTGRISAGLPCFEAPIGREAYRAMSFISHSRLLERAARVSDEYGGGSLTRCRSLKTQAGDVSANIPTNVIDYRGQIYLVDGSLYQGVRPPFRSVFQ